MFFFFYEDRGGNGGWVGVYQNIGPQGFFNLRFNVNYHTC
jgi:hypothetical protein